MKNDQVILTKYKFQNARNFGLLTEISKEANYLLGDKTGRSISQRTAHGLKRTFNLPDMHDDTAEDIVHGGMLTSAALLSSKSGGAKVGGLLLLFALLACYQNGK